MQAQLQKLLLEATSGASGPLTDVSDAIIQLVEMKTIPIQVEGRAEEIAGLGGQLVDFSNNLPKVSPTQFVLPNA